MFVIELAVLLVMSELSPFSIAACAQFDSTVIRSGDATLVQRTGEGREAEKWMEAAETEQRETEQRETEKSTQSKERHTTWLVASEEDERRQKRNREVGKRREKRKLEMGEEREKERQRTGQA